jgi:periplasmic protein TonB
MMLARQSDARASSRVEPKVLLWIAAAAIVAAAHGGAVWTALRWKAAESAGEPPPAVMIELSPVALAPKAPPQEIAPGPQMTEAAPPPTDTSIFDAEPVATPMELPTTRVEPVKQEQAPPRPSAARPMEEAQPDLPPPPEPTKEAQPIALSDGFPETPTLPHVDNAQAVLEPPPATPATNRPPAAAPPRPFLTMTPTPATKEAAAAPRPNLIKPPAENKKSRPRRVDRKTPLKPEDKPEAPRTSAPPAATARRAETAAAPSPSASLAPSAALASWKGALLALLNRNKRYPSGATGVGTASVAFAIDRAGAVVFARLNASSGDAALDAEAVALLRRSSPVPAPPPGFGGVVTLTVPIRFDR